MAGRNRSGAMTVTYELDATIADLIAAKERVTSSLAQIDRRA
jgi:hypothetical protein